MDKKTELLVVTTGNDKDLVPWSEAQLIKRRVRFGFGPANADAKTDQIIIAK